MLNEFIAIVSPVTRREYIPIGSTATSMSPTVTGAPMPILTTHLQYVRKKQRDKSMLDFQL
ncbi:hypothetical protein E2650_01550 [Shewanella xiamenensis]|uniref:Uncharacterized protein n=1 Tax=Shewanella xiamenensis TaxID=332186 RepID=A0AAW6QSX8_9GAMM|nr:hypothetical protein [Shewanella xiamenensis]